MRRPLLFLCAAATLLPALATSDPTLDRPVCPSARTRTLTLTGETCATYCPPVPNGLRTAMSERITGYLAFFLSQTLLATDDPRLHEEARAWLLAAAHIAHCTGVGYIK